MISVVPMVASILRYSVRAAVWQGVRTAAYRMNRRTAKPRRSRRARKQTAHRFHVGRLWRAAKSKEDRDAIWNAYMHPQRMERYKEQMADYEQAKARWESSGQIGPFNAPPNQPSLDPDASRAAEAMTKMGLATRGVAAAMNMLGVAGAGAMSVAGGVIGGVGALYGVAHIMGERHAREITRLSPYSGALQDRVVAAEYGEIRRDIDMAQRMAKSGLSADMFRMREVARDNWQQAREDWQNIQAGAGMGANTISAYAGLAYSNIREQGLLGGMYETAKTYFSGEFPDSYDVNAQPVMLPTGIVSTKAIARAQGGALWQHFQGGGGTGAIMPYTPDVDGIDRHSPYRRGPQKPPPKP